MDKITDYVEGKGLEKVVKVRLGLGLYVVLHYMNHDSDGICHDGGHFLHFGRAKSWSQRRPHFFPAGTWNSNKNR